MGYNGFVKISANILQSSIMLESPETFKCWITILASCDSDGIARISPVFLMSVCHLDKETVLKSISILEAPDQLSRSQNEDGRRIKRIDGGYEIINYHKYRDWTYSSNPDSVRKKNLRDRKKAELEKAGHVPENAENTGHVRTPLSSVFCNLSSSSDNNSKESVTVCDINTSSENSNSSDSKKESIKKKEKNVPEFAMKLAEYLKEKIVESGTDMVFKDSHLTGWADDFRLMVTSDKRTVDDIQKKIDDIFVDSFWSKQIRSAGKMREQWKAGKLDGLKPRQTAIARQQENSAQGVDLYASEKKYDSGRCRRYIDAMLRKLYPVDKYGEKWESYIIPETDTELMPIWDIIVADGGYINGVKTKEAALKIVSTLKVYS